MGLQLVTHVGQQTSKLVVANRTNRTNRLIKLVASPNYLVTSHISRPGSVLQTFGSYHDLVDIISHRLLFQNSQSLQKGLSP